MARSAVVILEHGKVVLIRRVRAGQTYYLFPGGGIEEGETPEGAAVREAYEELGVVVALDRLLAMVQFEASAQYYYLARVVGGVFGTGTGQSWHRGPHPQPAATPRSGSPWMN
jgi:8-oxo-dGTP pyrophosphatase MutT (NUDIX family)